MHMHLPTYIHTYLYMIGRGVSEDESKSNFVLCSFKVCILIYHLIWFERNVLNFVSVTVQYCIIMV